jgi:hypothetical protein
MVDLPELQPASHELCQLGCPALHLGCAALYLDDLDRRDIFLGAFSRGAFLFLCTAGCCAAQFPGAGHAGDGVRSS